jgi:hypothetical protein
MEDKMPKLTDTQLIILSGAAKRDDGSVLPLPKKLKLGGDAIAGIFKTLLRKKLVSEEAASQGSPVWREGGEGQGIMLIITKPGLRAIGVEPAAKAISEAGAPDKPQRGGGKRKNKSVSSKPSRTGHGARAAKSPAIVARPGTQQAKVIDLLRRIDGASIAELAKATGWQPHSVRGVISGVLKKKLGLAVASEPDADRGRVYRIVGRG